MGQPAKADDAQHDNVRFEEDYDCLLVDDDTRDDLAAIISAVEKTGLDVQHAQRITELANKLESYAERRARPSILIIDVYLPNFPPNFALLGRPEIEIEDNNTAGVTLYEKVLMEMPGISQCPVIFISSHKNIAVLAAHRLRVQRGAECIFISKDDFVKQASGIIEPFISNVEKPTKGIFTPEDFELLWAGVCEFFELSDSEKFSALGMDLDAPIDFLTMIQSTKLARDRINVLVDIGTCLQILFPDAKERKFAMSGMDEILEQGSLREVISQGDTYELDAARVRLEQLCGIR